MNISYDPIIKENKIKKPKNVEMRNEIEEQLKIELQKVPVDAVDRKEQIHQIITSFTRVIQERNQRKDYQVYFEKKYNN